MELQTLTYMVVGATFALYIGIAIWARAGSTKEFYVAAGLHLFAAERLVHRRIKCGLHADDVNGAT